MKKDKKYFIFDKKNQEFLNDEALDIENIIHFLDTYFFYEEDYNWKIIKEDLKSFLILAGLELKEEIK